ncbi:MAG: universal stress protein, partial [Planctomycetaceae bacterium]
MLPRFKHLLIPLDFTEKNRAALEIGFEIAVHNHSRVTLLHVVEEITDADEELKQFVNRLSERGAAELE